MLVTFHWWWYTPLLYASYVVSRTFLFPEVALIRLLCKGLNGPRSQNESILSPLVKFWPITAQYGIWLASGRIVPQDVERNCNRRQLLESVYRIWVIILTMFEAPSQVKEIARFRSRKIIYTFVFPKYKTDQSREARSGPCLILLKVRGYIRTPCTQCSGLPNAHLLKLRSCTSLRPVLFKHVKAKGEGPASCWSLAIILYTAGPRKRKALKN